MALFGYIPKLNKSAHVSVKWALVVYRFANCCIMYSEVQMTTKGMHLGASIILSSTLWSNVHPSETDVKYRECFRGLTRHTLWAPVQSSHNRWAAEGTTPLCYGCIARILITHHHASGQARAHYWHSSTKPEDLDWKWWWSDHVTSAPKYTA